MTGINFTDAKIVWKFTQYRAFRRAKGASSYSVTLTRVVAATVLTCLVALFWAVNVENTYGIVRYYHNISFDYMVAVSGDDADVYNSALPAELVAELRAQPDLRVGIMSNYLTKLGGKDVIYQSYEPRSPAAPRLHNGRQAQATGEVVLDHYLASDLGTAPGRTLLVRGHKLQVVGTSDGTDAFCRRRVFMTAPTLQLVSGVAGVKNVVIVGTPSQAIVNQWHGSATFYTRSQWLKGGIDYGTRNVTPLIVTVIEIVTFIALLSLLGFLVYQFTLLTKPIALLRAIGMTRAQAAITESLALIEALAIGYVIGLPLAAGGVIMTNHKTPGFHSSLNGACLLVSGGVILVVSALSLIPVLWKTSRFAPMAFLR